MTDDDKPDDPPPGIEDVRRILRDEQPVTPLPPDGGPTIINFAQERSRPVRKSPNPRSPEREIRQGGHHGDRV